MRNAFRDFFRRRRVAAHVARHGDWYSYHDIAVEVPPRAGLGVRSSLLRDKYERDEAAMILKHLPADLPVIELGGSLGVISALIRSRLSPGTRHIIVEANPALVEICAGNAARKADGVCEVVSAAVHYDGATALFAVDEDIHSSMVGGKPRRGVEVEVPAVTLSELYRRIGSPAAYCLVSDIEGAEYPVFTRDQAALAAATIAILEIHPEAWARAGGSEAAFFEACRQIGLFEIDRRADVVVLSRGRPA